MGRLVSVSEAAALVGRNPSLVRKFVAEGRLPAVRVGRVWALDEDAVREFFAQERPAGRPPTRRRGGNRQVP